LLDQANFVTIFTPVSCFIVPSHINLMTRENGQYRGRLFAMKKLADGNFATELGSLQWRIFGDDAQIEARRWFGWIHGEEIDTNRRGLNSPAIERPTIIKRTPRSTEEV
jgi:hypothetical protein